MQILFPIIVILVFIALYIFDVRQAKQGDDTINEIAKATISLVFYLSLLILRGDPLLIVSFILLLAYLQTSSYDGNDIAILDGELLGRKVKRQEVIYYRRPLVYSIVKNKAWIRLYCRYLDCEDKLIKEVKVSFIKALFGYNKWLFLKYKFIFNGGMTAGK